MRHKFLKFLLSFILIVVAIGIWFSQNWYKMPKYIGDIKNPTYEMLCTGQTGHAEVIRVEYDSDEISERFWSYFGRFFE